MPERKKKVIVTRYMPPEVTERLRQDYDPVLNLEDKIYGKEELSALCSDADAILSTLGNELDAAFIAGLPEQLKIISSVSVGYDHIDLEAAKTRGILVTNTPDVLTDATADIALLLLLGAARRAGEGHQMIMDDEWTGWSTDFMLGKHVTGARLGLFGMGRIGQAVAKRARAFDMEIHYHNRNRLTPELEQGATYHETVASLFSVSDFLSLHAASTEATRNIINRETLEHLPKGAVLVNTARGDLVDDKALIDALSNDHLSAAGLDVFRGEPNIDPGYRTLKNVFLLPHLGSATHDTRNAMGFRALDNLDAFFDGASPKDLVT